MLRQVARDLTPDEIQSADIKRLVADMVETMREYNGVGLAAPQIHQSLRILVIEAQENPRYPDAPVIPLTVLFNMHLEGIGEKNVVDWEGCLSVPGLRGQVPRYGQVRGRAMNVEGKAIEFEADGFLARVLQHEGDHLDGRVYLDSMTDMRTLSFNEELARYGGTPPSA